MKNTPNTPLISVIMPCYNAGKFLREAIESILNQSYTHFELLAINDGSTDSTLQILEEYAAKDSRIRVITNEENIKLIRTLNKGIDLAQGEYIARMDADDISLPNRFEVELDYLLQNPEVDIVSCAWNNISENGEFIREEKLTNGSAVSSLYASFFYVAINHPSLLGKTSVFKDNKFSTEDIALHTEDSELWGRLLIQGYKIVNIDDVLFHYRINPNSVSHLYTSLQDDNFVLCLQKHFQKYLNQELDIELVGFLVNRINSDMKKQTITNGFSFFKQFKSLFIKKEHVTDTVILKEINDIYYVHLFDLCWQTFKRTQFKCLAIRKLFSISPHYILNKNRRKYVLNKF